MDFTSQDAIDAAQRLLLPPRMLVGAPAPTASPPAPEPVHRPPATVRTVRPDDPPPLDRTHPSLLAVLVRPLAVLAILALLALSIRL